MTANALRALTCKDLAQLAKKDNVSGWHAMRKEELIRALLLVARRKSRLQVGPQWTYGFKIQPPGSKQVAGLPPKRRRRPQIAEKKANRRLSIGSETYQVSGGGSEK